MYKKMKDKLTIVIPCRNEEDYIIHLLNSLRQQKLGGARIIIADCSTDNTRQVIKNNSQFLNIEIIDGGPVAIARNNGARLATTPYILFIDADVVLLNNYMIRDAVFDMEHYELDLIGAKIYCYDDDERTKISFMLFNFANGILKHFIPFAVGAFMLTRQNKFNEFGGFPENYVTSEDFFLSRMYNPCKFKILNHYFGQDSRRFKKMGYFGMVSYLFCNFIHRNDSSYWQKKDHSNYWN